MLQATKIIIDAAIRYLEELMEQRGRTRVTVDDREVTALMIRDGLIEVLAIERDHAAGQR